MPSNRIWRLYRSRSARLSAFFKVAVSSFMMKCFFLNHGNSLAVRHSALNRLQDDTPPRILAVSQEGSRSCCDFNCTAIGGNHVCYLSKRTCAAKYARNLPEGDVRVRSVEPLRPLQPIPEEVAIDSEKPSVSLFGSLRLLNAIHKVVK